VSTQLVVEIVLAIVIGIFFFVIRGFEDGAHTLAIGLLAYFAGRFLGRGHL
jgi:cell shape-determining protein MreD